MVFYQLLIKFKSPYNQFYLNHDHYAIAWAGDTSAKNIIIKVATDRAIKNFLAFPDFSKSNF